jgi:hypothetical protein
MPLFDDPFLLAVPAGDPHSSERVNVTTSTVSG